MHVFRIFFVTTILIPVLVVAATSDENGLRIRKPRNIVITEDGTRTGRRHNPVNFTDVSCPSLGCTGNLTANSNNGKGSLAASLKEVKDEDENDSILGSSERRLDSSETPSSSFHHHQRPLKLEIKSIKNSTRFPENSSCSETTKTTSKCIQNNSTVLDYLDSSEIGMSFNEDERFDPSKPYQPGPLKLEIKSIKNSTRTDSFLPIDMNNFLLNDGGSSGRAFITAAVVVSSIVFWSWKAFCSFLLVHGIDYIWTKIKYLLGYSHDTYDTLISIGHDNNHQQHGWQSKGWGWPRDDKIEIEHYKLGWGWKPGHHDNHHHPHHDKQHNSGWGWPGKHGHGHHHHHSHRIVHKKPYPWYHPASKLWEQPTVQYSPWGKEYPLYAFDQRQAYKYREKYNRKFGKYKRKYYRKKGKEIRKAERQKQKAWRKKQKAARRKKKVEAFRERLKDWFNLPDKNKDDDGDDDDGDDDDGDDGEDDVNDDLEEQDEKKWKESAAEIEKGKPPGQPGPSKQQSPPPHSYYKPGEDYDPIPFAGAHNQKHLRITK